MPVVSGIEAVKLLRSRDIQIPIIMLTVFEDDEHIYDALCAGANGYLLKSDIERIQMALQEVLNGGAPLTGSIAKRIIAVSYTHLDVYKRQSHAGSHIILNLNSKSVVVL